MSDEVKQYKRALGIAINALHFYANPENYHAIAFMIDRPAGGFADDFSSDHDHEFYDRPMPGKVARRAISRLQKTLR